MAVLAQPARPVQPPQSSPAVTAREDAYRANNVGVARLEQYDFPAATAAFRRALQLDPSLAIARLNLGIALFYGGEQEAARKELEAVRTALADRPQVEYVLGLIARTADRTDDAIEAFTRVRKLDPTDAGAAINLGQLLVQARRFDDAIALLRPAVEAEPFNATAAYGLATALVRSGAGEPGKVAMEKFQTLRESGYAVTFSQAYLEQGRYAEAIASTGAEPGLVRTDASRRAVHRHRRPHGSDRRRWRRSGARRSRRRRLPRSARGGRAGAAAASQRQGAVHAQGARRRAEWAGRPRSWPATATTTAMWTSSCSGRPDCRCCARMLRAGSPTSPASRACPARSIRHGPPHGSTPITTATSI